MKKTILAAAVASTVTSFAMADISITGDAKFEYKAHDTGSATSNTTNTEMHINIVGKQGDTSVVIKTELDSHGTDGSTLDIEDNYITTKVGDVSVKAGNYASGTSGLLGEIEEGSRATNKVTLGYSTSGVDFYLGNSGTGGTSTLGVDADTVIDGNMFAGAGFTVAGQRVEIKHNNATKDSWGAKGSVQGINYRYETSDDDTDGDTSYLELSTKIGGMTLQYAALDADATAGLEETDSSVFAQEAANSTGNATAQQQIALSTAIDGTNVTFKTGTIENGLSSGDQDYFQVSASRALASGATLVVSFDDNDTSATASKETLEVELNVKF